MNGARNRKQNVIEPGATLGVFGGGQLGRMFAAAARRRGYRTIVYAPETDSCAADVADEHICASYDDEGQVIEFSRRCDGVTIEFENVPVRCLELAMEQTCVRPGPSVLAAAQDRLEERRVLDRHDLPTASHAAVRSFADLERAVAAVGTPGVLKTAREGYDGRGQLRIASPGDAPEAWSRLGTTHALYEAWVPYQCELSVLVARSPDGTIEAFGPIENQHVNHILDLSLAPARVDARTARDARTIAGEIATALDLEGVLCVEMFLTRSGTLLINELAPRPHNSGHLTIEACSVSQFDQQVRVLCGYPPSEMTMHSAAAMKNVLGDLWETRRPQWCAAQESPSAHLHLYGKGDARRGRKMGHVTVLGETPGAAAAHADAVVRAATGAMACPS